MLRTINFITYLGFQTALMLLCSRLPKPSDDDVVSPQNGLEGRTLRYRSKLEGVDKWDDPTLEKLLNNYLSTVDNVAKK